MKIEIGELSEAIISTLIEYGNDVAEGMKSDVDDIAKQTVKKVKEKAPVRQSKSERHYKSSKKYYAPGSYKKSWTNSIDEETSVRKSRTIYSKGHSSLTHLLEKPHKIIMHGKNTGKYTQARQHIAPAEEWAIKKLEERTIKRLEHEV